MKTCINISFPSKIRFRKKVHSQASDHVWFFLTYSQSVRAKKRKGEKSITVINFLEFNVFHPEKQARLSWKLGNAQFTAHHTPDCRRGRHLGLSGGVV